MKWISARYVARIAPFILSVFLTGCFGQEDINNLAMVMAVGIDEGKRPGTVLVTAQIARPSDAVGQTGAPVGGTGKPIWTAAAEGRSIFEAMRNLDRFSSRRVYWGHNKIIVLSAAVARHGVNDAIDFFTRNHELRMRTWVMVTPKSASEIVASKTGLQVIPGDSVDRLFHYSAYTSEAPPVDMRTFQATFLNPTSQAVLPRVDIVQRGMPATHKEEFGTSPQVELSRAAYFIGNHMVGWMTIPETRGALWFLGHETSREMVLHCPDSSGKWTTLEMRTSHFVITPHLLNGKVSFVIHLRADFDLVEADCPSVSSNLVLTHALEMEARIKLREELLSAIHLSQRTGSDFLRLGERVEDRYPAEWRTLRDHWPQTLSRAEFLIHVKSSIRSPVLLAVPTRPGSVSKEVIK
ncbi:MAG: Ger(x)C family spore germination protein [Firmicutes bacterium]|nr:Ger(x)C family spore germination protein [Bacillota bacterium]